MSEIKSIQELIEEMKLHGEIDPADEAAALEYALAHKDLPVTELEAKIVAEGQLMNELKIKN